MKRRRINLLSLTLKKLDFETTAKKVQFYLIGLVIVLVVSLGVVFAINQYFDQQLDLIEKSKKPLTQYFQTNEEFNKKIKLFIYKNNLLKNYIKQDANAYGYYNQLLQQVTSITPDAQISNFTVDNAKQTQFEITFASYDTAQDFLNALESPDFIKSFEFLKLTSFDVAGAKGTGFVLNLQGQFTDK